MAIPRQVVPTTMDIIADTIVHTAIIQSITETPATIQDTIMVQDQDTVMEVTVVGVILGVGEIRQKGKG
ncbi:MAG: hypothetical protein COV07_02105 [Candidatus Vogelbacteria bacterium CG10_big_fil_rev_8_21_14_0_10_45_14]|uniref:Uncharacterized protein n=1 Tax=Candidatus Vogelbacteria bacterium CG10_big_fil_rev_8_21_14_0_10_45_14 TaxID=1975042 RepID=A0A2H0RK79_9BACT|nr:MAG: hypothetical protein COV07_02105 [Candidatus Vogelbacteria bacterium CG10_big_fil_rev_8_21_14_0_10_45_14]